MHKSVWFCCWIRPGHLWLSSLSTRFIFYSLAWERRWEKEVEENTARRWLLQNIDQRRSRSLLSTETSNLFETNWCWHVCSFNIHKENLCSKNMFFGVSFIVRRRRKINCCKFLEQIFHHPLLSWIFAHLMRHVKYSLFIWEWIPELFRLVNAFKCHNSANNYWNFCYSLCLYIYSNAVVRQTLNVDLLHK